MDPRTFITRTLVQIAEGINSANAQLADSGAIVNPANASLPKSAGSGIYAFIVPQGSGNPLRVVQSVNLDVAVVATEGSGTKGGIGIVVGAIALGTQGSATVDNSSQSRVQFSVPIALPEGKV